MSNWKAVGVVDTIYEEDYEHPSSSPSPSPSPSPSRSSPPTPLHTRVKSWSLASGQKADVLVYVMGTSFHLHKDPLSSRSRFLKRQLTELTEITLPFNITAETFTLVADFCYGSQVVITPFNVAALRTAAELLEMTETNGKRHENLKQTTETYFRRVVVVNEELAMIVFRSCLHLLPEAETTAFLVSRCLQALNLTGDGEELDVCLEDVIKLPVEEFLIVLDAMQCKFTSHDVLYIIIDLYIKGRSSMITEEQKTEMCNFIDCDKLSPQLLMHAVQNPTLPLRFIVRTMLIEQLNTRRAIVTTNRHHTHGRHQSETSITLGSILQRDSAAREAAQLKAEMDATNSRIESLAKELAGMKKLLQKSEMEKRTMEKKLMHYSEKERSLKEKKISHKAERLLLEFDKGRSVKDSSMEKILHLPEMEDRRIMGSSARSASFHYESRGAKIERGDRRSTSFASFRCGFRGERTEGSVRSKLSCIDESRRPKKINGKGLISRLKGTLMVSKSASKRKGGGNGVKDGDHEKVIVTEDDTSSNN